jgi:hypothetical protein
MGRRRRNSVVPFVVLGAALSIGVVALSASRFGWRRTAAEPLPAAPEPAELDPTPEPEPPRGRRFAPAVRWDVSPEEYAAARESGNLPPP